MVFISSVQSLLEILRNKLLQKFQYKILLDLKSSTIVGLFLTKQKCQLLIYGMKKD
jgi:hypothetical protein